MDITFEEEFCLKLYLIFFNRYYDVNDDRKCTCDNITIMRRHVEMQNIMYLKQILLDDHTKYSFLWNYKGPESSKLKAVLNELDKKSTEINKFYLKCNEQLKKYYQNYNSQLQYIFPNTHINAIKKFAISSYVLEDILKEEEGSEILANIIYFEKCFLPGENLDRIINELNERGLNPSPRMIKEIWKDLAILNIIEMEPKTIKKRKLEIK